jgi:hypothetical protein
MKNPWVRIGTNSWSLALEASSVIGLRALKIASGGRAAEAETRLMVREKCEAGWAIQGKALAGNLGWTANAATSRILPHYRRKVCQSTPTGKTMRSVYHANGPRRLPPHLETPLAPSDSARCFEPSIPSLQAREDRRSVAVDVPVEVDAASVRLRQVAATIESSGNYRIKKRPQPMSRPRCLT